MMTSKDFLEKKLKFYDVEIRNNPESSELYYQRASIFFDLAEYNAALADLNSSLKLNPYSSDTHYLMGITYGELNQVEQELKCYTRSIEIDNTNSKSYNNRGLIYMTSDRLEEAKADFISAAKYDSEHSKCRNNLGLIYAAQGDFKMAIDCFSEAIDIQPLYDKALIHRARAYMHLNQFSPAIDDVNKVLNAYPHHQEALRIKGTIERRKDKMTGNEDDEISVRIAETSIRIGIKNKQFDQIIEILNISKDININVELIEHAGIVAYESNNLESSTRFFVEAARRGSEAAADFLGKLEKTITHPSIIEILRSPEANLDPQRYESEYVLNIPEKTSNYWKTVLASFLKAETYEELQKVTKDHPEILQDKSIALIEAIKNISPQIKDLFERNIAWLNDVKNNKNS